MDRDATQKQQFLIEVGDTPYLVKWTPDDKQGHLEGELAGDFIGAEPWSRTFPLEPVRGVGLELFAEQVAAYEHAAAAGGHPHRPAPQQGRRPHHARNP